MSTPNSRRPTPSRRFHCLAGWLLATAAGAAVAGPEQVAWPDNYASLFVRYASVDKPKRQPPIVRYLYVNREALVQAAAAAALPDGTVIVMEDHAAALDAAGEPRTDSRGRFIATAVIGNVFVQEKRAGFGVDYPADVRNGDWEYAWFLADGTRKPDAKFDKCFSCHAGVADADYNFSLTPFVADVKGP